MNAEERTFDEFEKLTQLHFRAITEVHGKQVAVGLFVALTVMTPRQFAEDHVACVCCVPNEGPVDPEQQTNCMALKMCQEVVKFADDAGHPEWTDGEEEDPLERNDLPKV